MDNSILIVGIISFVWQAELDKLQCDWQWTKHLVTASFSNARAHRRSHYHKRKIRRIRSLFTRFRVSHSVMEYEVAIISRISPHSNRMIYKHISLPKMVHEVCEVALLI